MQHIEFIHIHKIRTLWLRLHFNIRNNAMHWQWPSQLETYSEHSRNTQQKIWHRLHQMHRLDKRHAYLRKPTPQQSIKAKTPLSISVSFSFSFLHFWTMRRNPTLTPPLPVWQASLHPHPPPHHLHRPFREGGSLIFLVKSTDQGVCSIASMNVRVGDTYSCSGLTCWKVLLRCESVWEQCAGPLLVPSPSSLFCRTRPVHFSGIFDLLQQRPRLCLPHALFFTSRRPSGLNLDMSHEQGYCGLLYCRRQSVPSHPRDTGGKPRRSHYSTWSVCLFTISYPPLLLISPPASLPASSFTLTHFFLFLNISASFLFPLLLVQCNYGNGFSPPHTLSWWLSTSCPETGLIILLRVMFS